MNLYVEAKLDKTIYEFTDCEIRLTPTQEFHFGNPIVDGNTGKVTMPGDCVLLEGREMFSMRFSFAGMYPPSAFYQGRRLYLLQVWDGDSHTGTAIGNMFG